MPLLVFRGTRGARAPCGFAGRRVVGLAPVFVLGGSHPLPRWRWRRIVATGDAMDIRGVAGKLNGAVPQLLVVRPVEGAEFAVDHLAYGTGHQAAGRGIPIELFRCVAPTRVLAPFGQPVLVGDATDPSRRRPLVGRRAVQGNGTV